MRNFFNMSENLAEVSEVNEGDDGSDAKSHVSIYSNEADNPSNWVEHVELVTNKKDYLVESMNTRSKTEYGEFLVFKDVLERLEATDQVRSTSMREFASAVPLLTKEELIAEVQERKEQHLRRHMMFEQLRNAMLQSPDTENQVSVHHYPPIDRPVFFDPNGNKRYL
jgi:hypothetical protein